MKLKYYILIGYLTSILITVIGVFFGVSRMFINSREVSYILIITIIASFLGGLISLFLLSNVFSSLKKLKGKIKAISLRKFDTNSHIKTPLEFKELEDSFNSMSLELSETFESLADSEKEKAMMVAQLTHDIKTPITSIQATVEGILDGIISPEETNHYLKTVGRQTNRLNKLVEELNFLSLDSSNSLLQESTEEVIYLDKLLIDILSEFQLKIEKEERYIHIEVSPQAAKIRSDYNKLSRILLNLITNALKYSKQGTQLSIKAYYQDDDLRIDVRDQGQGIKEKDLDLIFKRLYRVETSRNMETGGHGLGLYIARQLAHQLGGDISVKSQYGQGSQFTLLLKKGKN
ncbi:HAMP domain-containing histidine kinase [Streptococcus didelphis]|uniref:sensor histidine kinase n=1 Tax=Streptococcus didelphis TaxID=102886 RepID=UPI00037C669C|nr:HAMP domain-containing sensor histidine kinase [Streptococcus didelphis]WMB29521.1 HAMP domain-containing histidine kinase [Streptococcus didelphis]WMB29584.1 HAMP domain-containing histidine kinase [Streptococcus didelphis]